MEDDLHEFEIDRDAMRALAPELADEGLPEGPDVVPRFSLAWAVAPGGETVPGPGEPDADAVRAWAERALVFQCRAYRGRGMRMARPLSMQLPDVVADHVFNLARDEFTANPASTGPLMARVAARLAAGERDPGPPAPAPSPAPAFAPRP